MENFDELIRKKVEEKVHPFKRQYWSEFAQKAGFSPGLGAGQIALISTVATTFVAAGVWVGVTLSNQDNNTPDLTPKETLVIDNDTAITEEIILVETEDTTIFIEPETPPISSPKPIRKPIATEEVQKPVIIEQKPEEKKPEREIILRILTIDPDTIKSEYE